MELCLVTELSFKFRGTPEIPHRPPQVSFLWKVFVEAQICSNLIGRDRLPLERARREVGLGAFLSQVREEFTPHSKPMLGQSEPRLF